MNLSVGSLGTGREWARDLAIATGIGSFLGVIGPFGSFNGGPLELRVFFWVANFWIGYLILAFGVRLALRAGAKFDLPVWFTLALGVAITCAPLALAVAVFASFAWPGTHGQIRDLAAWYGQTLAIAEPCAFGYVYLVGDRARRVAARAAALSSPPASPDPPAATPSFLAALPPRLGRDLLCLQMEDHYLRVHTALGSDLVLTPLKDALAELTGVEGLQVHRSWWVARAAVAGSVSEGRNLRLTLVNGLAVPVARASIARLRASGWLGG